MNYPLQRRQALANALKKHSVDAFLVTTAVNGTYLTGFTGHFRFYSGASQPNLLVDHSRFKEQIKEECSGIDVHIRGHNKTTYEAAVEVLGKAGAKAVAVEGNRLTLGELEMLKELAPKTTFVPINGAVESQR